MASRGVSTLPSENLLQWSCGRETAVADNLKELTASIVASYVEANKIAAADLAAFITSTYAALREAGRPAAPESEVVEKPTATQVRKSITPDALISFIDGKPYKMLQRHLTGHGLTAKAYQERYGLPSNYPLTAPSYSAARSALAIKMGLGRKATPEPMGAPVGAAKAAVAAKGAAKPARAPRASKGAPAAGERAGPGTRVPKAVRSPKAKRPEDETFT
jgi:predicted transcriptional regulator